jgi:alpha-1,2-mannosyltransferase
VFALNGWYVPFDLAIYLDAGDQVLAGRSPYADAAFVATGDYVYPPPLAVAITPLSALPDRYAATLWTLAGIGAIVLALVLLGVRDRRCFVLALLFPYTIETLKYGEPGSFLLLLVAVLWYYRDAAAAAGGAVAGALALKLFLWPVIPWLAFTRRWRAAAYGVLGTIVLVLGSWAVIGFRGLTDYPELLRRFATLESHHSYSAAAVARALGLHASAAQAVVLAAGAGLLALAWRAARRDADEPAERDRRSLTLVLAAALVLTPIVWQHYLALLVAPIALARPRLSPLWALPLAAWPLYGFDWYDDWPRGDLAPLLSTLLFVALVFVFSLRRPDLDLDRQQERELAPAVNLAAVAAPQRHPDVPA